MNVKLEDVMDEDIEADKKRIKERSLPHNYPEILVSIEDYDACKINGKGLNLMGGMGEG